jgi:hypothetical protein
MTAAAWFLAIGGVLVLLGAPVALLVWIEISARRRRKEGLEG